jgi:two-component system nitrogen regulation response regulator NtrX
MSASKILIVDDEPNIQKSFSSLLTDEGHASVAVETAEEALRVCGQGSVDLVLLDLQLPGMSGIDFLKAIREHVSPPVVLVISGQADIPMALETVRLGAVDFLEKPVQPEKLLASVASALALGAANRQRDLLVSEVDDRTRIVGQSKAMRRLLKTIDQVAPTDSNVLITGENGTGKELVATRLWLQSARRERPFVRVNCPGIPETLFESELFGHVKGSFTGAVKDYPGKFALADGGTILLDEIGDLPLSCQAKLLRVLETGEVETIGSSEFRQVDTRVICATNRDLKALVAAGRFREDLYYRISVFILEVPSLGERREDIPLLVGAFLAQFDPSGQTRLAADALASLVAGDFPGNIRQLRNTVERLSILHQGRTITADMLSDQSLRPSQAAAIPDRSLTEQLADYERNLVAGVLRECDGNISQAARRLGVDRANLSRKVKDWGLK